MDPHQMQLRGVQSRVGDQLADAVERGVLTAWFQRDDRTLIGPCADDDGDDRKDERPYGNSAQNDRQPHHAPHTIPL